MGLKKMKKDELITVINDILKKFQEAEVYVENIDTKSKQINKWYEDAKASIKNVSELETSLTTKQQEIETAKDKIIEIQNDVQVYQQDINKFYNELFEQCGEDSNEKNKEQRINDLEERLTSLVNEQEAKFKQIEEDRKTLFSKIESLLPSATSASLAASYKDAHDKTKSIIFLWGAFFIVLLGLFVWYARFFVAKGSDSLGAVLAHVLTGSPLIWLAWYLQKSIAQQSQIRQEYNHKQRVMTMYEGFVKAIDESGSKAHKEDLLSIMLKTVQSNPADILKGHDTLIDSIASKASKIPSLFKENISEESKKDV